MSRDRRFDLAGDETAEQDMPPPGERQTPRAPGRGPTRPARKEPAHGSGAAGLPRAFSSTCFLLVGAALTVGLWLGQLNPRFGLLANQWPWDLFREYGPNGGDAVFVWDRYRAFALCVAVFALAYLVAAIARPGRARGVFVLLTTFLAFTSFIQPGAEMYFYAGTACIALLGGALLSREGILGGKGGRALLFVALVLVGGQLFFPHPRLPQSEEEARRVDPSAYRSMAITLRVVVDPPPDKTTFDMLQEPGVVIVIAMALLFLLGLFSLFGPLGRWAVWTGGILLLVAALAPSLLSYLKGAAAPGDGQSALDSGLSEVAALLQSRFAAFLLPLAAAVMDLSRPRS
jgi:hypothetical protein